MNDFKAMNVTELKKPYLQERGVSVSGLKKIVLPVYPNFEKDQTNDVGNSIIYDM